MICGNTEGNVIHVAREMMFGLRETFHYLECGVCGTLSLQDPPSDFAPYYPSGYYSFKPQSMGLFERLVKQLRYRSARTSKGFLGQLLVKRYGIPPLLSWTAAANIDTEARILDVGAGAGDILSEFAIAGFKHLLGIDPFIPSDIQLAAGVRIEKKNIADLHQEFDFIMLHHSFEHMSNPLNVLKALQGHLKVRGCMLLRIPLASSYAWRTYGVNWVQLDAPRHLYLFTERSIAILAKQAGLVVEKVVYDSTAFQFWGSQQYKQDLPLRDLRSYQENPKNSIFRKDEITTFEKRAAELNLKDEGDTACFYLRAISN
jgi:SAM-dependent methyltransferase